MLTPSQIEKAYADFTHNLLGWSPDSIISVDLNLLKELDILSHKQLENSTFEDFAHLFQVIETNDKVTLHNEQFLVWIIPKMIKDAPTTQIMIAQIQKNSPKLELIFSTVGVYNTPKYILKVLEKLLSEIIDTHQIITAMEDRQSP